MHDQATQYSVIIPIYNAEKTLRRCVDSLLSQLGEASEIILVNDGSPDHSGEICEAYAKSDPRIHYISKPNGGVSSARNAGLDAASGKYVMFVDSDDYVSPDYFQCITDALQRYDWDLIRFSLCDADRIPRTESVPAEVEYRTRKDAFPKIIDDICSKALNSPCGKVYRREILEREQIQFPLGASVAEDRALNIRYSMHMTSYFVSSKAVYYVNTENDQSLSRKQHADLNAQFEITGEYVRQAILHAGIPEEEKEQYRRAYNFGICRAIYKDAKDLIRNQVGWTERQKALLSRCREINGRHMRYPNTKYCRLITLPVRLSQAWAIDLVAKRLVGK